MWKEEFTAEEQQTLLGMMESCSICFPLEWNWLVEDQHYVVPDLLPEEEAVQDRIAARWREDAAVQELRLEYDFLHTGILRKFLCEIGTLGGYDAVYWRYGCCFYDVNTGSRAIVRSVRLEPDRPAGCIHVQTCDGRAGDLLATLKESLMNIRIGQEPRVVEAAGSSAHKPDHGATGEPLAEVLEIAPPPTEKPVIYFSYAWGEPEDEHQQVSGTPGSQTPGGRL